MTCLAAFKILLYGYTDQEDLCVATLVANRTRQETEGLIGLVVNTVMLRTNLGGQPSGRELLQRVRATTLGAYAHQELPFEEVMRILEDRHKRQRTALSPVMVVWQNAMLWPLEYATSTLTFETMEQSVKAPDVALTTFDIILTLRERPRGLALTCLYKTDLFEAMTIDRMLDDFQYVLTCLGAQPEQALATFCSFREPSG
jgi:non-ribosomal peptide synthetase component F